MTHIHQFTALELARLLAAGDLSATEVLDHTYARIRRFPQLGAFAHLTEDLAREQAREPLGTGPLAGVPVPIKDLTRVAGVPFEAGSVLLRGNVAQYSDGVAQRLRAAGTLMVGKTSCPEFGLPAYTEPDPAVGPPARTPWDLRRTAGGSSGGAAAAVAAGLVPVAHGSDGGGSIRIPAACCGVVGLKPSLGVVSPGPRGTSGPGLVTDGALARTVRDCAALLDEMAGGCPGDVYALPRDPLREQCGSFLAAVDAPLRGARIGLLMEPCAADDARVHPEALAAARRTAVALEDAGHHVEEIRRPITQAEWQSFMPVWSAGAAALGHRERRGEMMPLTRWLAERGERYTAADLLAAQNRIQELVRRVARDWEGLDAILCPTLSGPPAFPGELQLADPAADFHAQCRFTPWTSLWNMTGWASLSLPVHRARVDGVELPFAAMLSATRPGGDGALLALAAQVEEALPGPGVREPRQG